MKAIYILFISFLFSCSNNIEHVWAVKLIVFEDKEIELNVNHLIFKKENKCIVPQVYNEWYNTKANWEYVSKNKIRIFNCEYSNFNDTFSFKIEQENLFLQSKKTFIRGNL
ncbi:MAG: hypothetical protein ACPGVD_00990 [Flavobacteriales bacterium]